MGKTRAHEVMNVKQTESADANTNDDDVTLATIRSPPTISFYSPIKTVNGIGSMHGMHATRSTNGTTHATATAVNSTDRVQKMK